MEKFKTFKDILDYCTILDSINSPPRPYNGKIHLSEIGCFREYFFKNHPEKYIPPRFTPEEERVFSSGSREHEAIQSTLIRNGFVKPEDIERSLESDIFPLETHTDIAEIKINGIPTLADIKTIKCDSVKKVKCPECGHKFESIPSKTAFEGLEAPIDKHKKQVIRYIYFFNQERIKKGLKPITQGMVIYLRKDNGQWIFNKIYTNWKKRFPQLFEKYPKLEFNDQHRCSDIKEFLFDYDELEALYYIKEVEELYEWIKKDILPPPIINPTKDEKFYCDVFCRYKKICNNTVPF